MNKDKINISKNKRLALLEGLDTSKMTKKEIGLVMGQGLNQQSIRKFILVNKIPSMSPAQSDLHPVTMTNDVVLNAMEKVAKEGSLTYENLGKELNFSKQRAMSLLQKLNMVEDYIRIKAK